MKGKNAKKSPMSPGRRGSKCTNQRRLIIRKSKLEGHCVVLKHNMFDCYSWSNINQFYTSIKDLA